MSQSTADKVLDAMFYESDVTYIGGPSKEPGHRGMATENNHILSFCLHDRITGILNMLKQNL